jgi:plastocyanin
MMKKIKASKCVDFRWSALALVAIVSVTSLSGAAASSASQHEGVSGMVQAASAEASTGSPTEVKIDNFAFTPGVVTVKAGTQVTWINHDDIPHTVDSTQGKFKSAALDTDDKFEFRFTEPGEYPFYCRMHPKMTGKIIVQP